MIIEKSDFVRHLPNAVSRRVLRHEMKGGTILAGWNRLSASQCAAGPLLRGKRRHAGKHLALEELERRTAAGGDVAHLRRLALLPGLHNIHPVIVATKKFLYLLRHVLIQFV